MAKPKKEPTLRPRIQSRYLDLLRRIYPAKASYPDGQLIEHHIDETTTPPQDQPNAINDQSAATSPKLNNEPDEY